MKNLNEKKILIIICGGIAAYKSLELIRLLKKNRSTVKCILTKGAQKFITPLSVASLSQERVYTELFNAESEAEMDHIALSRWSDLILVAPATANKIAKMSKGISDDLASTVLLASNKKIFIAPAMNVRMWENDITKENVLKLKSLGHQFIGPELGDMACGEYGEGKMSYPKNIAKFLDNHFGKSQRGKGFKTLVTAGPTREYIDPVRYLSNRSSGKQGFEIAKAMRSSGFDTTLISGPTNLKPVEGVKMISVNSAQEMLDATLGNLPTDVAIFSAAVSDWKFINTKLNKIKKSDKLELKLEKNIDILAHVSKHNSLRPRLVVGFSAETEELEKNSIQKLNDKNCDWIVANDVSNKSIGFDTNYNEVTIYYKNKNKEKIIKTKKSIIAESIVDRVLSELN